MCKLKALPKVFVMVRNYNSVLSNLDIANGWLKVTVNRLTESTFTVYENNYY